MWLAGHQRLNARTVIFTDVAVAVPLQTTTTPKSITSVPTNPVRATPKLSDHVPEEMQAKSFPTGAQLPPFFL
jgi:hypothetical protein